jgi:RNA polymerase sigma factor (sigma-70 family)
VKKINLKTEYPDAYTCDYFCEVEDSVADALDAFRRLRHAQVQQHSYNRVNCYYEDGLTEELMTLEQESPLDLFIQKETEEELYLGVQALDPRTRRRLVLHFISGLTQQQIADIEGVNRSNVARSISLGVRQLRKIISGNF